MKRFIHFIFLSFSIIPLPGHCQQFADSVIVALLGGTENRATNLRTALTAKEGEVADNTVLSLGGGFVVVDLGVLAVKGDGPDLRIYEAGNSYPGAANEPFHVMASSTDITLGWRYLGEYPGDVTDIDLDATSVDSIKYLAIIDARQDFANREGGSPGADIDAVEILNFTVTSVKSGQNKSLAETFRLLPNFPNPFNPGTTIEYEIGEKGQVRVEVFNNLGQMVKSLVQEEQFPGQHRVFWDGTNFYGSGVSSGSYYYRLTLNGKEQVKRMILLR